jgi:hypothetical protein
VTRDRFVEVQLTPDAYRHGLALTLPEVVHWRPRHDMGPLVQSIVRIPIAGRDALDAVPRRKA